jgi:hypothetical protein
MLGQQSKKNEPSGNGPISSAASKNPTWPDVVESMPETIPTRPDRTASFSAVS